MGGTTISPCTAAGPSADADSAYQRGDYAKAAQLFRPLAEQGDAKAQFSLGWMYFTGQIVPLDAREGMRWYRKAAEQGLSDAQYNPDLMYVEGHSTLQDFVRAHMWLNIAAATSSGDDSGEAVMLRGFAASQITAAQIAIYGPSLRGHDGVLRDAPGKHRAASIYPASWWTINVSGP